MSDEHQLIGIGGMVVTALIILCILVAYGLHDRGITFFPESVGAMMLGCVVGAGILLFDLLTGNNAEDHFSFSATTFFYLLLPPIIFEAGYNMKTRRLFFRNFTTICMLAVGGTTVATIVTGFFLYGFAAAGLVPLDGSNPIECLIFGSLISATDPVATLAIMRSLNVERTLYALIFGESVLNDAVSIVLFNTFSEYVDSPFTSSAVGAMIFKFLFVMVGSVIVGTVVALLSAIMFRRTRLRKYPAYEMVLVFFFAYFSYLLAESLKMSGIVSLFFCGIIMAHYTYFNLSPEGRTITSETFHAFGLTTETFLFAYMGMTIVFALSPRFGYKWNFPLIVLAIVGIMLGRAANVFPNALLANMRRKKPITWREMLFMWYSGLRGAVAFGLAISLTTQGRPYLITTTMMVVVATTVIGGMITEPVLKRLGLQGKPAGGSGSGAGASDDQAAVGSSVGMSSDDYKDDSEKLQFETIDGVQLTPPRVSSPRAGASARAGHDDRDPDHEDDDERQAQHIGRAATVTRTGAGTGPAGGRGQEEEEAATTEAAAAAADPEGRYGRTSSLAPITTNYHKWMTFDRKYLQPLFGGADVDKSDQAAAAAAAAGRRRNNGHH